MKRSSKKWIPHIILAAVLLFGIFFVRSTLNEKEIKVVEKTEEEPIEIHPAKVNLHIVVDNQITKSYKAILETDDTVGNLLEYLRKNTDFTYEKVAYIYGIEIDSVDGLKSTADKKWILYEQTFENDTLEEITMETLLQNKSSYYLKYTNDATNLLVP